MRHQSHHELALECLKLARAINDTPDTGIVIKNAGKLLNFVLGDDASEQNSPASEGGALNGAR